PTPDNPEPPPTVLEPAPPDDAPAIPPPVGFAGEPPEHALNASRADAHSARGHRRERRPSEADIAHWA
ncbi:MAG: hypothetical protein M3O50_19335, partial [Myxococcota bacterium]|nr:hypothetical protein [Myxococcota bacterium]